MATLTATIETKLARQGDLAVEVVSLKNDVADTQRSLAADLELAAKLAESCSSQSSEWEERQESRGKRGSLCESHTSRKTVTCHVSFCLFVPTERAKYVWLVQSRRRPEKWTRTREAGSRGSATTDSVSGSCVVSEKHHHKTTVAGFFTEPLKPNTGKLCENSLKTHLIVLLFFQVSGIQNGSMYVLGMRQ